MKNLKEQLIRLGSTRPELQKHIRPVLDELSGPLSGQNYPDNLGRHRQSNKRDITLAAFDDVFDYDEVPDEWIRATHEARDALHHTRLNLRQISKQEIFRQPHWNEKARELGHQLDEAFDTIKKIREYAQILKASEPEHITREELERKLR